jgi:hypothetical protein
MNSDVIEPNDRLCRLVTLVKRIRTVLLFGIESRMLTGFEQYLDKNTMIVAPVINSIQE